MNEGHDKTPAFTSRVRHRFLNARRGLVAAFALWLIWVGWRPVSFTLPEDLVRVADAAALASLPAGATFLIEGTVAPITAAEGLWQGRFTFVHRERQDFAGGPSKDQRIVEIENRRPALRFQWGGGTLLLPAGSYRLTYAPGVKPRFWPRKWLGIKRVDDWHASSTGFRPGEAALAYGQVTPGGQAHVEELMQWPVQKVVARIGHQNRLRRLLVFGFKLGLSGLCLVYGLGEGGEEEEEEEEEEEF